MPSVPAGSGDGRPLTVSVAEQDNSLRVTVTGELDGDDGEPDPDHYLTQEAP